MEGVNSIGFFLVANRLRKMLAKFVIVNPKIFLDFGSVLTTMSLSASSEMAALGFPKEMSMMSLSLS